MKKPNKNIMHIKQLLVFALFSIIWWNIIHIDWTFGGQYAEDGTSFLLNVLITTILLAFTGGWMMYIAERFDEKMKKFKSIN